MIKLFFNDFLHANIFAAFSQHHRFTAPLPARVSLVAVTPAATRFRACAIVVAPKDGQQVSPQSRLGAVDQGFSISSDS